MDRYVIVSQKGSEVVYLTQERFDTLGGAHVWLEDHEEEWLDQLSEGYKVQVVKDVAHPRHYNTGNVETIDEIKATLTPEEYKGFLKGNIIKYRARYFTKDGVKDLLKALWYEETLKNCG